MSSRDYWEIWLGMLKPYEILLGLFKIGHWSFSGSYPPTARQGHLVRTAPTTGETTAWTSTPGYRTYTSGQPSTWLRRLWSLAPTEATAWCTGWGNKDHRLKQYIIIPNSRLYTWLWLCSGPRKWSAGTIAYSLLVFAFLVFWLFFHNKNNQEDPFPLSTLSRYAIFPHTLPYV